MIEEITWWCPECDASTKREIIDQHVTQGSPGWYIDSEVECLVCGNVEEVTDHSLRDPRDDE
jgi:uncharacterized Zn finger protein